MKKPTCGFRKWLWVTYEVQLLSAQHIIGQPVCLSSMSPFLYFLLSDYLASALVLSFPLEYWHSSYCVLPHTLPPSTLSFYPPVSPRPEGSLWKPVALDLNVELQTWALIMASVWYWAGPRFWSLIFCVYSGQHDSFLPRFQWNNKWENILKRLRGLYKC